MTCGHCAATDVGPGVCAHCGFLVTTTTIVRALVALGPPGSRREPPR